MDVLITVTQENIKRYPIHTHRSWEFMCYIEGSGILETPEQNYPFQKGTVLLIPPGMPHGSHSEKQAFVNICVHTDVPIFVKHPLYLTEGTENICAIFRVLRNLYFENNDGIYNATIEALVLSLKELILSEYRSEPIDPRLKKVHEIIADEFQNADFSLRDVIAATGYVNNYFCLKFKKQYGYTPKEYLDEMRIGFAKNLLMIYGSEMLIVEVAHLCGYRDAFYFSRKFKKKTGMSPQQFIRNKSEERNT